MELWNREYGMETRVEWRNGDEEGDDGMRNCATESKKTKIKRRNNYLREGK